MKFISLILLLFLIPLAIGGGVETARTYDKLENKITITDIHSAQIETLKLINNTDYCSRDCSAYKEITLYKESVLIDSIKFLGGSVNSYRFDIYDGSKWNEYKEGETLTSGTYLVKLSGTKRPQDSIDWVVTAQGQELTEWSFWYSMVNGTDTHNLPMFATGNVASGVHSGIWVNVTTNITLVNISRQSNVDGQNLWITDISNIVLGNTTFTDDNDFAFFNSGSINLTAGQMYRIDLSNDTLWHHACNMTTNNFPIQSNVMNFVNGSYNNGTMNDYKCNIIGVGWNLNINSGYNLINIESPLNNTNIIYNQTFSCTAIMGGSQIVNVSFWNDINGTWRIEETKTFESPFTQMNVNFTNPHNKPSAFKWACQACDIDNACGFTFSNYTGNLSIIQASLFNSSTYETAQEGFAANLLYNSASYPTISVILNYNGTNYPTTKVGTGSNVSFLKSIYIPLLSNGANNNVFYWNITISNSTGSESFLSQNYTQPTSTINFTLCGSAPLNIPYINFTFKNETSGQESLNSTFSSSWTYSLNSGAINKTLTYSSTSSIRSYAFCFQPQNRSVTINPGTITYTPQGQAIRYYTPNTLTLTNTTRNVTLYGCPSDLCLIPTSGGSNFVIIQVTSVFNVPITGAYVSISRSGYGVVSSAYTDSSGVVTFILNPGATYSVNATKAGYPVGEGTIQPTNQQYTIVLGGEITTSTVPDYTTGVTYSIKPSSASLSNDSTYSFNFSLQSVGLNIDDFGFILVDQSNNTIDSISITSNNDTVNINAYVVRNSTITMFYFWTINSTTIWGTRSWSILNDDSTQWSIFTFFKDLKRYLGEGMFGLNGTGMNILLVIIVTALTIGIWRSDVGIVSSTASFIIVAGIIFIIFDIIGLFTYSPPFPNYGVSIISLLAIIGISIWEANH